MYYFIGLDIHSKSSTFAVINKEGECILRKELPKTKKSLESVTSQINGQRHLFSPLYTLDTFLVSFIIKKRGFHETDKVFR